MPVDQEVLIRRRRVEAGVALAPLAVQRGDVPSEEVADQPLVLRRHRIEVAERVRHDGSVEVPLDEAAVRAAGAKFKEMGVEAIAVCFLHAYANPAHERRAAEILKEAAPGLFVSTSADVVPAMREFERWTTATVNAFAQPMFDRYVEKLENGLKACTATPILGSRGEVLGTFAIYYRQARGPSPYDLTLLEAAREEAMRLHREDPGLQRPEHALLGAWFRQAAEDAAQTLKSG